jgi:hypothetical protein
VADFYTRLYPVEAVTVKDQPLFQALNQLADAMHMRWHKETGWLQLRSASFFNDRLKEVPNRLLSRWAAARRQHDTLSLDDLIEIAQLSDAQLDATNMAEGARECWGLAEWDLVSRLPYRWPDLRPHLRYLAGFTPAQRQEAMSPTGLAFTKLSLAQQQQFLAFALSPGSISLQSLPELRAATLHVAYTQPGAFEWTRPGGRALLPSPAHERTREAALQAARRIDPQVTEDQIVPTRLDLIMLYSLGPNAGQVRIVRTGNDGWIDTPNH